MLTPNFDIDAEVGLPVLILDAKVNIEALASNFNANAKSTIHCLLGDY
jgi:hypothetical protein